MVYVPLYSQCILSYGSVALSMHRKKRILKRSRKICRCIWWAGSDDPVGNFGKSVENVAKTYRECGIKDVSLKLYEKDRHEILNELDRQTVYEDILAWVEAHLI